MLTWLCVTFGVAFGSALLPVISIEVFIIGLMTGESSLPWLGVAAAGALGQIVGKLPYCLAARESVRLPGVLHRRLHRRRPSTARRERWRYRTKRLRGLLEALRERCHRHPHWMTSTYCVSSLVGLPPFMATVVLAGLVRMRMRWFVTAGLAGRFVRLSAVASCPAVFSGLVAG